MKSLILFIFIFLSSFCFAQTPNDSTKEALYKFYIAGGDSAFAAKNYQLSTDYYYYEAILLKQEEDYPKEKYCEGYAMIYKDLKCPFATKNNEINESRCKRSITLGDSAFALNDYYNARHNYYFAFYYVPDQAYAIKQARFCDSILNNRAFVKFETHYSDTLFVQHKYFEARRSYENDLGEIGTGEYLVDTLRYSQELKRIRERISICDDNMSVENFYSLVDDERCDGMASGYCVDLCYSAAKRAEALKDYTAAADFYDRVGETDKAEAMKKLAEQKSK